MWHNAVFVKRPPPPPNVDVNAINNQNLIRVAINKLV